MAGHGRPPLNIGTYGSISVRNIGASRYKARARFRDRDGTTRTVARFGQSKTDAKNALRVALAERTQSGRLDRDTTVRQLAEMWLGDVQRSDKAARTKEHYTYIVERRILPALGSVRVGEASTRVCDRALQDIAAASKAEARSARAVLNGMFRLAVAHDAATVNPVRETRPIGTSRKTVRALTVAETEDLTDRMRTVPRAMPPGIDFPAGLDLADLVDAMLGTGCRIGETLAWRLPVLDLDAGTVEVNATIIRVKGEGLHIQERPKTAAGWRVLALPVSVLEMIRRRDREIRLAAPGGVVFGSPFAKALRDPSNLAGDLREVLDELGYEWVTSHTFRKTVATRLDEAGWSARQIADQLGHSHPSMTQDVYMGRKVVSAEAARVLER